MNEQDIRAHAKEILETVRELIGTDFVPSCAEALQIRAASVSDLGSAAFGYSIKRPAASPQKPAPAPRQKKEQKAEPKQVRTSQPEQNPLLPAEENSVPVQAVMDFDDTPEEPAEEQLSNFERVKRMKTPWNDQ